MRPYCAGHYKCHFFQYGISRDVTFGVVEGFKVVDVKYRERKNKIVSFGLQEFLFKADIEVSPVEKAGEGVGHRKFLHFLKCVIANAEFKEGGCLQYEG